MNIFGKCLILLLSLCSLTTICLRAEEEVNTQTDSSALADSLQTPSVFIPFGIGEQIDYHISFGFVSAGKARISVEDTVTIEGHQTFHVVSTARSAKAFDYVFKVRDSIETWIDADSLYSHRFRKRLSEGSFRDEKYVEYTPDEGISHLWDRGKDKGTMRVEKRVQDVFSAGFKVRTMEMKVGDTLRVNIHDIKKSYTLLCIVHAIEKIETLAGIFECFKVEPQMKSGGLFNKEKGAQIYIWVTTDERRIPVMMKSKVSFGSVVAVMESYKAGQPNDWIKTQ